MFAKIRTVFNRIPTTIDYTPEELINIGQALNEDHLRLAEIRQLSIEDLDRLYRETIGQ